MGFHVGKYTVRPMDPSWACPDHLLQRPLRTQMRADASEFVPGIPNFRGAWRGGSLNKKTGEGVLRFSSE